MRWREITVLFGAGAIATTSTTLTPKVVQAESEVQFICAHSFNRNNGLRYPTTVARTERGKVPIIQWTTALTSRIMIMPQQACEEISPRFQQAYDNGTLNFVTNGTMNGQPVICTTSGYGGTCRTLLMTLRSQDLMTRRSRDSSFALLIALKDQLNARSAGPVYGHSDVLQLYLKVDIDKFLQETPVMEK